MHSVLPDVHDASIDVPVATARKRRRGIALTRTAALVPGLPVIPEESAAVSGAAVAACASAFGAPGTSSAGALGTSSAGAPGTSSTALPTSAQGLPKPRTFRQVALAVQFLVRVNLHLRRHDMLTELRKDFDLALRDAACQNISNGGQARKAAKCLKGAGDALTAISRIPGVYLDCLPEAKAKAVVRMWATSKRGAECVARIEARRCLRSRSPADGSWSEGSESDRPFLRHRKPFGGPTHLRVSARIPPVKQVMEEPAPKDAKCSACQLCKSRFHYGHTEKAGFCRWLSTVPATSATVPATSAIAPATSAAVPATSAIAPAASTIALAASAIAPAAAAIVPARQEDGAPRSKCKKRGHRGRGHQSVHSQEWRTRRRGRMRSPAARSRTKSRGQEGRYFGPGRPAQICRTQRGRRRGCTSRSSERGRACDRAQGRTAGRADSAAADAPTAGEASVVADSRCRRADSRTRVDRVCRSSRCRRADSRRGERGGACDRVQGRRDSDSRDSRSPEPPFNVFDRSSLQLRPRSDVRR